MAVAARRITRVDISGQRLTIVSAPIDREGITTRLTPAERAICRLVDEGLSNAAIASARGTSPRTVANQLRSIYRKLGVPGRRELFHKLAAIHVEPKMPG